MNALLDSTSPRHLRLVTSRAELSLPNSQKPRCPRHFDVERIYLAKGSLATPERASFVERIVTFYPHAERIECLGTPHNRIDLGVADPLARHRLGKRTLVFGEHRSAVRFSEEKGNTCPNYWHFSPYGFCFYGCRYCYLAGTAGVWFSPAVKIYVNLPGILEGIDRAANRLARPTAFYLGKLQDGLALDPLTAYSTVLVPFFARHRYARQVILTKSADVDRLLGLDHRGRTILSWSLLPPEVASRFEENVPLVEDRIAAMKRCAEAGYPVRAVLMPLIPVSDWESVYPRFLARLLADVPVQRLTLGGICSYRNARGLMERKLGRRNAISESFAVARAGTCTRYVSPLSRSRTTVPGTRTGLRPDHVPDRCHAGDGRVRYPPELRVRMYSVLVDAARRARPDVEIALCLEESPVWEALDIEGRMGRCNCVL